MGDFFISRSVHSQPPQTLPFLTLGRRTGLRIPPVWQQNLRAEFPFYNSQTVPPVQIRIHTSLLCTSHNLSISFIQFSVCIVRVYVVHQISVLQDNGLHRIPEPFYPVRPKPIDFMERHGRCLVDGSEAPMYQCCPLVGGHSSFCRHQFGGVCVTSRHWILRSSPFCIRPQMPD